MASTGVLSSGVLATTTRVQIDFGPPEYQRMVRLKETSGAKSNADVIRNAVRFYEWYVNERAAGWKLQLAKDDTIREIELLL